MLRTSPLKSGCTAGLCPLMFFWVRSSGTVWFWGCRRGGHQGCLPVTVRTGRLSTNTCVFSTLQYQVLPPPGENTWNKPNEECVWTAWRKRGKASARPWRKSKHMNVACCGRKANTDTTGGGAFHAGWQTEHTPWDSGRPQGAPHPWVSLSKSLKWNEPLQGPTGVLGEQVD